MSKVSCYCLKNTDVGCFSGCPVVEILLSNAGGTGSIPGQGARIPHASQPKKNPKHKTEAKCNKFSKDFKNGPHQKRV